MTSKPDILKQKKSMDWKTEERRTTTGNIGFAIAGGSCFAGSLAYEPAGENY